MNSSSKLMNVSTRQLHAFLEVTRLQSFAKAAEQVHLSPSGMSMLIKELEEQMGARLFDRTTRSLTLTEAGRRLQPVAERMVVELRALGSALDGSEAAVRSRLRVAATPMISVSLMPEVIRGFGLAHPQVQVQLSDVEVGTVRQQVLDGDADIGFGFFVKPAVGLSRQPLCRFRLMRISPPDGADSGQLSESQPWSRLKSLPLVGLPIDNPIQAVIEKQLMHLGLAHQECPRVNLIGTLIGMVRAGRGSAIVPAFALQECLRQGLRVALLREPVVHLDLYLAYRRGTQQKAVAQAFAEVLRQAAVGLAH